jgi:hypothetical protein
MLPFFPQTTPCHTINIRKAELFPSFEDFSQGNIREQSFIIIKTLQELSHISKKPLIENLAEEITSESSPDISSTFIEDKKQLREKIVESTRESTDGHQDLILEKN